MSIPSFFPSFSLPIPSTSPLPKISRFTLLNHPTLHSSSKSISSPIRSPSPFPVNGIPLTSSTCARCINLEYWKLAPVSKHRWSLLCFKHENHLSDIPESELIEDRLSEELVKPACDQRKDLKVYCLSTLQKVIDIVFRAKPWIVPWTVKTIIQVILLWIASFWLVGSWVVPFLAYTVGFRKETLTDRGQALYSLLTDVAEGVAGIAILCRCLANFHPLPSDWFKFKFEGKWHIDIVVGCLMFPLINHLSQVNLNLLPILPTTPVTVSSVEQSIAARDPVAMALYAVVVSVCAPIWEEIVFRGFLLPSLTKYMPVWCSILFSSVAFALAHFNMQRMLPLILLGTVMGVVFARSRNLLPSMLLHSLWNIFVFLDLMKW